MYPESIRIRTGAYKTAQILRWYSIHIQVAYLRTTTVLPQEQYRNTRLCTTSGTGFTWNPRASATYVLRELFLNRFRNPQARLSAQPGPWNLNTGKTEIQGP